MQRRVGDIAIESIAAEHSKFTAPIVLIHGLWCTAAVWRQFMGYLVHRGWTCHAINLRGRNSSAQGGVGQLRIADHLDDVRRVLAACPAPPVVVGHDLGAVLALAGDPPAACAVVALAPVVPRAIAATANPILTNWRVRLAAFRRRPLPPPGGRRAAQCFAEGGPPGGLVAESARAVADLSAGMFALPTVGQRPTLLIGGETDPFCTPRDVERLARHVGAAYRTAAGAGHAMPWQTGWQHRVAEMHRWLIQALGERLLLLHGGEEE